MTTSQKRQPFSNLTVVGAKGRLGSAIVAKCQTVPHLTTHQATRGHWPPPSKQDLIIDASTPYVAAATIDLAKNTGAALLYCVSNPTSTSLASLTALSGRAPVCVATNLSPLAWVLARAARQLRDVGRTFGIEPAIHISERHPTTKKDTPSATALSLSAIFDHKVDVRLERHGPRVSDHALTFSTEAEQISITLSVNDLSLAATAALVIGQTLTYRQPGLYGVSDLYEAAREQGGEPPHQPTATIPATVL